MNKTSQLIPVSDGFTGILTIGRIARETGVKDVTLRFYEAQGLLPKPQARKKAGHRRYHPNAISHVRLIRAARGAGMSLTEIKAMLRLLRGFKPPAVALMREVRETIARVDNRIEHLREIKQLLRNVLENPQAPEHRGPLS